jgi:fatty acid desaturase 2 (delta-6 desaturase)
MASSSFHHGRGKYDSVALAAYGLPSPKSAVVVPTPKMGLNGLQLNEIQIGDKAYTIDEKFIRKHPGGTVLKSKLGTNATQAFTEFHYRSKKAQKYLATLPSRPAPEKQSALLDEFDELRAQFVKEGLFDFSPVHVTYRLLEILFMTIFGYWLVGRGWYWTGMSILGITSGRCGWIQHEANHNSLTGVMKIDKLIGSFFFAVGEAGSATWWISSHNRHHASPQHLGYDSDLNTLPAMAFDAITARMGKPKWLQFQAWTFEFSTWLVVLFWKVWLHPVAIWRKKAFSDGAFLIGHYVIWWNYFSYMGIGGMIFSHLVWGSIAGMYLFTNFALSHTHKEVLLNGEQEDWFRSAVLRTVNVKHSVLVNWWMGYLNMQIEHHLFPNMPQFRHPQISDRIKALAKKHGLDYDERGYWETCYAMFKNLNDVGHGAGVGTHARDKLLVESKQE